MNLSETSLGLSAASTISTARTCVQTPAPVHQELLDWLATEFIARGWSVKAMHRLIVCSATYRQSSNARPELQAIDPANRLLARQRRLRVEAEIIRDLSLSAAGLLVPRLGGPGVYPYQPEGVLDGRAGKATWTTSAGDDRFRRGLRNQRLHRSHRNGPV